MASKLKKAILNLTLGTAVVGGMVGSTFTVAEYSTKKEKEGIQAYPPEVQRTYELEEQLNKALKKRGLEAVAEASWPEFRQVYGPIVYEYAHLLAQENIERAREEINASQKFARMYLLLSVFGIAIIGNALLFNVAKITNYLCGDKKEEYSD